MEPVLNVVVEDKIPFIKGLLEPLARVTYAGPDRITRQLLLDTRADAIIVRTRTRCDSSLLDGTGVKLIVTATIGTDHIDLDYCRSKGIAVANAPGCNAPAVAQYVLRSALAVAGDLRGLTIGVIGVGHVGSIVARWADSLGMNVLLCDPPRAESEGPAGFCDMATVAGEADIITVHTPLTSSGSHPTFHLVDRAFLDGCLRRPLIINSARGPVTDTKALIKARMNDRISGLVIDCWESEPRISRALLSMCDIATPHIAGYSAEGKQRATRMAVEAFCRFFNLPLPDGLPDPPDPPLAVTQQALLSSYDPLDDTVALTIDPDSFESLRNGYHYRNEPTFS